MTSCSATPTETTSLMATGTKFCSIYQPRPNVWQSRVSSRTGSTAARAGYQEIEPDNIDSYERSTGLLSIHDAIAYLELLAPHAHEIGLAIGQKNSTDLGTRGRNAGLDFATAEECGRHNECDYFTGVYGDNVIVIEYTDSAFAKVCSAVGDEVSVVRRDVGVTAAGSGTYRYGSC